MNTSRGIIPIPIPYYVPMPLAMYSQPTPVPLPVPIPIPIPVFIPTTRNSAKGIMKVIKVWNLDVNVDLGLKHTLVLYSWWLKFPTLSKVKMYPALK